MFLVDDHPGLAGRERRAVAREQHLAQAAMNLNVRAVYGATILDEDGTMVGSMLVMDAAGRDELDTWLRVEPYIVENVWRDISVHPCQVPPTFMH